MSLDREIAKELYRIEAVQIKPDEPFIWTSGIKSPIYCDNRLTLSYPEVREKIVDGFVALIDQLEEKPDIIAGCATAGIPHAAWIAQRLNLPMIYVRSKPKGHGKGNQIEGKIKREQKVLVIEDLISTGGSSLQAALALQEEGAVVLGVFAIFTYGLQQASENFMKVDLSFKTITSFDRLLEELVFAKTLTTNQMHELIDWRNGLLIS